MCKFKFVILTIGLLLGFICMATAQELEKPVHLKVDGEYIDLSRPNYAAPLISDFDGDGLDDLIVGTFFGTFRFYRNVGSKSVPVYNDFTLIQAGGKDATAENW